jgi:hypothetical protein
VTPGTITDSYTYGLPTGDSTYTYNGTVTVTDSEGLPQSASFSVTIVSASVALTDFGVASGSSGLQLQVSYTIADANAAPFNIDLYTSPDGTTPDQLLQTLPVTSPTDLTETSGTPNTVSFTPAFDDIQSNYHLIAVADANGATSGIEFDGGIFYAQSVTASPPQNILYVFGSNSSDLPVSGGDTVSIYGNSDSPNPNSVVFDDGTAFDYSSITPPITGIHVRGEAGNDDFQADANVTLPLWLYGGNGTNTLVGGAGNNVIVGGSGTNVIHDGNGQSSPQVVDSSETLAAFPGLANYYQETGTWTDDPTPGTAYNGGQRLHATGAGDTAKWTFANLDASAYYDVYVTWSPEADASTTADYSVNDGGGALDPIGQTSVALVNQTQAPYDVQAAGVSWQDLGVFQAGSGALNVQLAANASSPVLANAVMIVPYDTAPLTNLTMGSFTVDSQGNLSVSYTINGEDSPRFNIGIYGSPDGRQPSSLLQTYPITDPTLLGGGGQSYTVTFPASLDSLSSSEYVVAQLDSGDAVEETSKGDNISAPLSGIFEQGDGTLFVLGNASSLTNDNIALTQDLAGNVIVNTADAYGNPLTSNTFSGVAAVILSTPGGNNTVSVDPSVTVPVSGYAGSGSSVTGTFAATDATPSVTIVDFEPTIDKGGIATLTAIVGNLGGLGFTVIVDWGAYQGTDTIIYPAGTTSFTMTHHYVDDGAALFAIDFPVIVNVISTDGQIAATSTSTMGQDVLPAINIAGGTGSIMAGNPVDLSAVVADPGEFGTFTYEWTATGGGDSFSSTSAIFDFTPTNNADHTISLDVIDPDGKSVNEMLTIPGYVWPSGGGSITPFVPDDPSVSIEQCNADGTTPASAVQAGSNAYFKITVGTDSTPLEGTVTVYYNTENGLSIDGSQVAYANTDYIATGGQLTFSYASGYASQIISVQTVVTSNGGSFSLQIPGIFDSDASTAGVGTSSASTLCSIQESSWAATSTPWTQDPNTGAYTAEVVSFGDPTLKRLAYLITGKESDWTALLKTNGGTYGGTYDAATTAVPPSTFIDVSPLLKLLEARLRDKVVLATAAMEYNLPFDYDATHPRTWYQTPMNSAAVSNYFSSAGPGKAPLSLKRPDCQAGAEIIYRKALLDEIGAAAYNADFVDEPVPMLYRPVSKITPNGIFVGEKLGDWGYISNANGYPGGAGRGENVICVSNTSIVPTFFYAYTGNGSADNPRTYDQWCKVLTNSYNTRVGYFSTITDIRSNGGGWVPTKNGFMDVASKALTVFEYNNK